MPRDPGLTIARDVAARRQKMVEMLQERGMNGRQLARALGYSLAEAQRYGLVARDYLREPVKEVPASSWSGPQEQAAWRQAQQDAGFHGVEVAGLVWACLHVVSVACNLPLTAVVGRQESPPLERARRLWWRLVFEVMPTLPASRLAPICGFEPALIREAIQPDRREPDDEELLVVARRELDARRTGGADGR